MKLRRCGMQRKLAQSFATSLDGATSELSSPDSGTQSLTFFYLDIASWGYRNSRNVSDFDSHRSTILDRSSSLGSRRSSSNGSAKHAYNSFSRSHYDKVRDKDKVRQHGVPLPRKIGVNARDNINSNHNNDNGLLFGGAVGSIVNKDVFERDFPSLGTEDRQVLSEITRMENFKVWWLKYKL
ncbi:hypothetical protein V6N12_050618 [Hibiscus sabdariffa]|uniref:Uncharacterized protein n=1 Tax=Hibiscus sabdariffa TaxID=183260 RepID=A0ABR2GEN0_9ROSI